MKLSSSPPPQDKEKEAFEALEGKLISDSELEIVLKARVMGPGREKASANLIVTIIDSTN